MSRTSGVRRPSAFNPYSFNTPIHDPRLLVGRRDQLTEARYYLDDARLNPRPFSLAFIGARASGKTSLLNAVEHDAALRDFVVVRLNLTEADVESPTIFFDRLIGAAIRAAHSLTSNDPALRQYEDIVTGYAEPDAYSAFAYSFPRISAKLRRGDSRFSTTLQEEMVLADLRTVISQISGPLCIFIDEGDVLARNRSILQALRNVLSSIERLQIIISGTAALFDVVDIVFSPIVRQFKRIEVGPFATPSETRDCIRQPLTQIQGAKPEQFFDFFDDQAVSEIHNISGGRPYEIQLLCHFMFRELQRSKSFKRMHLSADVLDAVVGELGRGHSLAERPLFSVIRQYDEGTFKLLRTFLQGDGFCNLRQIEFVERFADRPIPEPLGSGYLRFNADGLLRSTDGRIVFAGDELDRIYLRYYALRRGAVLPESSISFERLMGREVERILVENGFPNLFTRGGLNVETHNPASALSQLVPALVGRRPPVEAATSANLGIVYAQLLELAAREFQRVAIVQLTVDTPFGQLTIEQLTSSDAIESNGAALRDLASRITARVAPLGGLASADALSFMLPTRERLVQLATGVDNAAARRALATAHRNEMTAAYLVRHDLPEALRHLEEMRKIDDTVAPTSAGFLLLKAGRNDEAEAAFKLGIEAGDDPSIAAYDIGVLYAKSERYAESAHYFALVKDLFRQSPSEVAVLEVLVDSANIRNWTDSERPQIVDESERALRALSRFAANEAQM